MSLREVVEKYLAAAGGYGRSIPLASLGLSRKETERVFAILDEDYHISRFFHFSNAVGASYTINGFPQTHISIDSEIQTIL
jgi:N-formylglutamate amidohydrolase